MIDFLPYHCNPKEWAQIFLSLYITFTAAHILVHNGEDAGRSFSKIGAVLNGLGGNNGSGVVNPFNGVFDSSYLRFSSGYNSNTLKNDYGVLRVEDPFYSNFRREKITQD